MNSQPLLSVIVPTYHRNEILEKCLKALAPGTQTLPQEQYEVIVTDDGVQSTAERMLLEQYPWARWVAGPHKGAGSNRNNGARHALGEWLAFIDDDCIPDPQWLESYAQAIATQPSYQLFEGRVYVDRPRNSLSEMAATSETGGYLLSGNFVCQKDVYKTLGGFDERFPFAAMEDVELRHRVVKAGYKFFFVKSASVCNPWRPKGGWREHKHHQESVLVYLSIHPEELSRINSTYYFKNATLDLFKNTIPGIWKYKGRGVGQALIDYLAHISMGIRMLSFKGR